MAFPMVDLDRLRGGSAGRDGLDYGIQISGELLICPGIYASPEPRAVGIVESHNRERLTLVFSKWPDAAGLVFDDVAVKPFLLPACLAGLLLSLSDGT